jgi:YidC/Oxa1 family membrane protein insertase
MEPDNKRQLMVLLAISGVLGAAYLGFSYFTGEPPAQPRATESSATPQAGEQPTPDGESGEQSPEAAPSAAERAEREELATIETDDFVATFTNLNTALRGLELKGERYREEDGSLKQMVTTDREHYLPLSMDLLGVDIPAAAIWEMERLSPTALRFSYSADDFTIVRKIEAGTGPYQLWSTVRVVNHGQTERPVRLQLKTFHYVNREDEEGGFIAARSPAISSALCSWGDEELTRLVRGDIEDDGEPTNGARPFDPGGFSGHGAGPDVRFAGLENVYFASAVAAHGEPAERCQMLASDRLAGGEFHGTLFESRLIYPRTMIAAGQTQVIRTLAYMGPKDNAALNAAGHQLPSVVDYGFFSVIAEGLVRMLDFVHDYVGNWGIAIILLTILVRIVLFPLTIKSFQSMARMRQLKPEMDRINELYKDEREKKGAATMELYRKHKINPLGGCLPQLLQLPIWFAFYTSLSTNVELYHAPFALWWTDLSAPDEFYVLPVALGALMFIQQKITPTTMDPMQAKMMMYFMPVMITSFMLFLPSGLCLYMLTNSFLGIGQQQWISRKLQKATAEEPKPTEDDSAETREPESGPAEEEKVPRHTQIRTKHVTQSKGRKSAKRRRRGRR